MIDANDKDTKTLPGIKEPVKRGRKPMFSEAMTASERKAKQRREQDEFISTSDPTAWSESDCMRVLSAKKFLPFHEFAWRQLGSLKGYL